MPEQPEEKENKNKKTHKEKISEKIEYYEKGGEEKEVDFEKKIKKIKEKLKVCQKEKEKYLAGWQRERADFINYRKDEEERLEEIGIFQQGRIILEFLTVLDSFEKAEEELKKISLSSEDLIQWAKGVLEIKNQIKKILEKERIQEIDTRGKFNPDLHEAIETVEGDDDKIIEVVQKGYLLEGKLLRPARVKVGKKNH